MTDIAPTTALGDLALAHPAALPMLERLQLDYCCGGRRSLEKACSQRGLDPHTVIAMIEALDGDGGAEPHDVTRASIAELCDHIVKAHHAKTRHELPRIAELLETVVRVHGAQRAQLVDVKRTFCGMRNELEQHFDLEEELLFPACRAIESGEGSAQLDGRVLELCTDTHELTGEALSALRELCGGYDPKLALCGTHRALLEALHRLEVDLHEHVHEENNLLFPRVRELAAANPTA
jgi:regulator of cell morphogenesis and NO signaling